MRLISHSMASIRETANLSVTFHCGKLKGTLEVHNMSQRRWARTDVLSALPLQKLKGEDRGFKAKKRIWLFTWCTWATRTPSRVECTTNLRRDKLGLINTQQEFQADPWVGISWRLEDYWGNRS